VQHSAHGFGRLSPHLVQQLLPHPSPSLLDLRSSSILRHRHSRVLSEDLVNSLPPKTLNPNPKLLEAHLNFVVFREGSEPTFFFFFLFYLAIYHIFYLKKIKRKKSLKSFEVEKALKYQYLMGIMC
jgi:hypothetical protein